MQIRARVPHNHTLGKYLQRNDQQDTYEAQGKTSWIAILNVGKDKPDDKREFLPLTLFAE